MPERRTIWDYTGRSLLGRWPPHLNWNHTPQPPSFIDLWARSNLGQRRWEVLLLAANLLGYLLLNAQFYYVHQAVYFDFSWDSYLFTVNRTLLDTLLKPINVTQVPMMIPVLGSLMGAMIVIPILAAQFYRWWVAVPFLLINLLVGHLPVMSFYLFFACLAVGVPRLRLPFSYANTLIGLLIMTLYVVIATSNPGDIVVQLSRPTDIFLLFAPWVFAVLAAAFASGIVLVLAKWLRQRPGVVGGFLILPLLLPLTLFGRFIGHDELQYRLLEGRYGPGSLQAFGELDSARLRELDEAEVVARVRDKLAQAQLEIREGGEKFIREYPQSRHVPSVLYLIARAADMNVDWNQWQQTRTLVLYEDFPAPASRRWWTKLVEDYGDSVFGLAARQRLAVFLVRDGQTLERGRAVKLLKEALRLYAAGTIHNLPLPRRNTLSELLKADPPTDMLNLDLESQARQCEDLLALLEENTSVPRAAGAAALVAWFKLDPHHSAYVDNLQRLQARYPDSPLHDNIALAIAQHLSAAERGPRLEQLAAANSQTDGGRQALLLVGEWYQHRADVRGDRGLFARAQAAYDRLITCWPDSYQARQAKVERQKIRDEFGDEHAAGNLE